MLKRATEIETGDIIRLEYGDYDNWVNFTVDRVDIFEKMVCVKCHHGSIASEPAFSPNEEVQIIGNE